MKIVFDIDETLNNLNEHVFRLLDIYEYKYKNLKYYNLKENDNLTRGDIKRIYELYGNPDSYIKAKSADGVKDIKDLLILEGINVIIHSLCINEAVLLAKVNWVSEILGTSGIEYNMELGEKNPIVGANIVVEDNLEYLLECEADYKILIDKPYNKFENYAINAEESGVIRVKSLKQAIRIIKEIVNNGKPRD